MLTASTPEQRAQRVERYLQTLDIKVTAALQSMDYELPAKYIIYTKQHAAHMMNIVPNSRSFSSTAHILTRHSTPNISSYSSLVQLPWSVWVRTNVSLSPRPALSTPSTRPNLNWVSFSDSTTCILRRTCFFWGMGKWFHAISRHSSQ